MDWQWRRDFWERLLSAPTSNDVGSDESDFLHRRNDDDPLTGEPWAEMVHEDLDEEDFEPQPRVNTPPPDARRRREARRDAGGATTYIDWDHILNPGAARGDPISISIGPDVFEFSNCLSALLACRFPARSTQFFAIQGTRNGQDACALYERLRSHPGHNALREKRSLVEHLVREYLCSDPAALEALEETDGSLSLPSWGQLFAVELIRFREELGER
ncbi:hypothetical protein BT69DRAFT_1293274 [Atractiella rhizophila]|nr:hypothetical protein BT69DRAFT_1293274 [Atractiella rhizophila]